MDTTAVVTLPMYDLPEVRAATSQLAEALAVALTDAGWPVRARPTDFHHHRELQAHWLDEHTALSHSCGLPVREALRHRVTVVGTFLWQGVTDTAGWYHSWLVVARDHPATSASELAGARPAINNPESLSGWASLGAALHDAGLRADDLKPVVATGAHVRSLAALDTGVADVASIDAITWSLLARHRPAALEGARIIGACPRIPATPLITRARPRISCEEVGRAVANALQAPEASWACRQLGITGFVTLAEGDYTPVEHLARQADQVLPRASRQERGPAEGIDRDR